nr:M14 family metallocarboxypeptidase [Aquibacillus saliphilus]
MEEDIKKLKYAYPKLVRSKVIGKSVDDRKLYGIAIGFGETEIFINGAHHAREWLTTALLMNMLEAYCKAYINESKIGSYFVKDILNKIRIWFVPMVNPDGVSLVQQGEKSAKNPVELVNLNNGRKDFSAWKANIRGVDLNRQYPADWNSIQDNTGKPAPMMYKGPHPLSEPEAEAIYNFTLDHEFKIAVAYHSSGEEIYWKYNCKGELLVISNRIAQRFSSITGYKLLESGASPGGGGFTDWFISDLKKPAFTPEISPLVGPRPVPLNMYDKIWNDNKEVGLLLAEEALDLH